MLKIRNTDASSKKKPHGTGKKRIEIKKIERRSKRSVTFSKRRGGLFKKADELCRVAGAEIAIIIFSPSGRLYSFGHPSVDEVVDRLLLEAEDGGETESAGEKSRDEEEEEDSVCVTQELGFWWEESVEGMDLGTVDKYKAALGVFRDNVAARLEEMTNRQSLTRDFLGSME